MGVVEEANKEIAREFMGVLTKADGDALDRLYADDFSLWTAGSLPFSGRKTRAEAMANAPLVLGMFPTGLEFEIVAITAEGERVAIEAISRGTHASGKAYANHYHFLMRIRDEKIVEFKEYMDTEHARDVFFS
jgi:hypothetical protein